MRKLFANRYFIVLLILFVCFLPTSLTQEAESQIDAIVTAVGIDSVENNELEVSVQIIVPTPSAQYSQQLSVVSTKAKSVSEGMSNLSLRLGKIISFPHCKVLVFNEKLAENGLTEGFDYLIRNKANGDEIVLLGTKDSAKELLNSISDIDNSLYFGLNNSGSYNKTYILGQQVNLSEFYKKYLTEDSSLIIGSVSLEKVSDVGMISIPSASGGSSTQSSQENSSKDKKTVVNKGESILIKNGKKVKLLNIEETSAFNWFNPEATKGYILLNNITDDVYNNATVGVDIERKVTRVHVYFDGDKPVYELDLDLYIRIIEVVEGDNNKNPIIYKEDQQYVTPALKEALAKKIEENISLAYSIAIENNADVMLIGKTFNKYHTKRFNEYKNSNKENILKGITFKNKLNIKEMF